MIQTTAECSCHLGKWQKYRSLVRIVVQVQWNLIRMATGVQVLKVLFQIEVCVFLHPTGMYTNNWQLYNTKKGWSFVPRSVDHDLHHKWPHRLSHNKLQDNRLVSSLYNYSTTPRWTTTVFSRPLTGNYFLFSGCSSHQWINQKAYKLIRLTFFNT